MTNLCDLKQVIFSSHLQNKKNQTQTKHLEKILLKLLNIYLFMEQNEVHHSWSTEVPWKYKDTKRGWNAKVL